MTAVRWARPALRPVGLYSRPNAAPQAGRAVLAFGNDPARELSDFGVSVLAAARLRSEGQAVGAARATNFVGLEPAVILLLVAALSNVTVGFRGADRPSTSRSRNYNWPEPE